MVGLFNSKSIRSRVMKSLNQKLDEIDALYVTQCKEIDEQAEMEKGRVADKHVESIIGKII